MKELTYEEWQKNPKPRMMWVWHNNVVEKKKEQVIAILGQKNIKHRVLAVQGDYEYVKRFNHCAEIEEPKMRKMTNKEFVLWLLEGIREGKLRQWRRVNSDTIESVPCGYASGYENLIVENKLIRENGGEWHEPLVEV